MATYLTRTQVPGTSRTIFTVSMWVKKVENTPGHEQYLFHTWYDGNNRFMVSFMNTDTLRVRERSSGSTTIEVETNRLFRDVNSWYHIVVRVDTTQGTASDRVRIYVNGVQETSFSSSSYPSQNLECRIGTGSFTNYLAEYGGGGNNFSGVASHWHYVDGQSLAPTVFGSTDSTTGEWKINTSPSGITYGNNGFFLFKDDNSVNDDSGEGHNFTLASGTLTKTEDCPSNVFATGNPLAIKNSPIFTNGNNTITALGSSPYDVTTLGTLGMSSGKFYYEVKWRYGGNQNNQAFTTGITASNQPLATNMSSGSYNNVWFNLNGGDLKKNNSDVGTDYPISVNSIVGFAWDLDNGTLKIHENGTYKNSGNAVVTGIPSDTYLPFFSPNGGTTTSICDLNFGNGYFGTTAVSSAGANASGNGIFEYDVPTGYTALSTKGLNL